MYEEVVNKDTISVVDVLENEDGGTYIIFNKLTNTSFILDIEARWLYKRADQTVAMRLEELRPAVKNVFTTVARSLDTEKALKGVGRRGNLGRADRGHIHPRR